METSCNEVEYCKFDFECSMNKDEVESTLLDVLNRFYKDLPVPGFRAKKATMREIKAHYRKDIDRDLAQELAKNAYQNAVSEKNVKPFGQPSFKVIDLKNDAFVCQFTLHTVPSFELKEYKGFSIPKPAEDMTADILGQKMIQELRVKNGETLPYGENDFIQTGDNVIINMKAFDGEAPYERFTLDGTMLTVGNINIPEFSENIIGMKVGDVRAFEITLPQDYHQVGGKTLKFEVELLMGSKNTPAALDETLSTKLGFKTFEDFNRDVMSMAASRVKEIQKQKIFDQISRILIGSHDFAVPGWITQAEAEVSAKNAGLIFSDLKEEEKNSFMARANNDVKLSLILTKVRENEPESQLTDSEKFDIIKTNLAQFTPDPNKTIQEIVNNGHINMLFARVADEAVLEFIQTTCNMVE